MSDAEATWEQRLDGLVNTLTGLGKRGIDPGATFGVQSTRIVGRAEAESLFRSSHWARRIVRLLPQHATRQGWELYLPDVENAADLIQRIEKRATDLHLHKKIRQAMTWGRLYGGAGLVLGVVDGQLADMPVNEAAISDVTWALVATRHELQVERRQMDANMPGFGDPLMYRLSPEGATGASNIQVHESRLLRFEGEDIPRHLESQNDGWSDSVYTASWNAIGRLEQVEAAASNIVQKLSQFLWMVKDLRSLVSGNDGLDKLMARLLAMQMSAGLMNAVLLDADGEKAETLTHSIAGLPDTYDRFTQSLSASSGIPLTLLLGQAPGGLTTDDAAGRTYWYDQVKSAQRDMEHLLVRAYTYLARAEGYQGEVQVEFHSLTQQTDKEKAEVRKLVAETDQIYYDMQAVGPDEIRRSRFEGEWSMDTEVDAEMSIGVNANES